MQNNYFNNQQGPGQSPYTPNQYQPAQQGYAPVAPYPQSAPHEANLQPGAPYPQSPYETNLQSGAPYPQSPYEANLQSGAPYPQSAPYDYGAHPDAPQYNTPYAPAAGQQYSAYQPPYAPDNAGYQDYSANRLAPSHSADSYYQGQFSGGYVPEYSQYTGYQSAPYQQPPQNYTAQQPFSLGYNPPAYEPYQQQYAQTPQYQPAQPQYAHPAQYQSAPVSPAQYAQGSQYNPAPQRPSAPPKQQVSQQSIFDMIDDLTKQTAAQSASAPRQQTMDDLLASVGGLAGSSGVYKVGDNAALSGEKNETVFDGKSGLDFTMPEEEEKPTSFVYAPFGLATETAPKSDVPPVETAPKKAPEFDFAPIENAPDKAPEFDFAPIENAPDKAPEFDFATIENAPDKAPEFDFAPIENAPDKAPEFDFAPIETAPEKAPEFDFAPIETAPEFDFAPIEASPDKAPEFDFAPSEAEPEDIVEPLDESVPETAFDGGIDIEEILRLSHAIDDSVGEATTPFIPEVAHEQDVKPEAESQRPVAPEFNIDIGQASADEPGQETAPESVAGDRSIPSVEPEQSSAPVVDFSDIFGVVERQLKANNEKKDAFASLFGEYPVGDPVVETVVEPEVVRPSVKPEIEIDASAFGSDEQAPPAFVSDREFFIPTDFGEDAVSADGLVSGLRYVSGDGEMHPMVDNVSFSVPRGAMCAFCSPRQYDSFALLEIVGGVAPFDSGSYSINGETVGCREQVEMPDLFYIDSVDILDVSITVRDFVNFSLYNEGDAGDADAILADSGLSAAAGVNVNVLSTTQKALLLLIVASRSNIINTIILNIPELCFSKKDDEIIKRLFAELSARGKTLLFAVVDRSFVESYASHLVVTRDGASMFSGTMGEFFDEYGELGIGYSFEQLWIKAVQK